MATKRTGTSRSRESKREIEQKRYAEEMQAYRNKMANNINNPTLKDTSFSLYDNVKTIMAQT